MKEHVFAYFCAYCNRTTSWKRDALLPDALHTWQGVQKPTFNHFSALDSICDRERDRKSESQEPSTFVIFVIYKSSTKATNTILLFYTESLFGSLYVPSLFEKCNFDFYLYESLPRVFLDVFSFSLRLFCISSHVLQFKIKAIWGKLLFQRSRAFDSQVGYELYPLTGNLIF